MYEPAINSCMSKLSSALLDFMQWTTGNSEIMQHEWLVGIYGLYTLLYGCTMKNKILGAKRKGSWLKMFMYFLLCIFIATLAADVTRNQIMDRLLTPNGIYIFSWTSDKSWADLGGMQYLCSILLLYILVWTLITRGLNCPKNIVRRTWRIQLSKFSVTF